MKANERIYTIAEDYPWHVQKLLRVTETTVEVRNCQKTHRGKGTVRHEKSRVSPNKNGKHGNYSNKNYCLTAPLPCKYCSRQHAEMKNKNIKYN